MGSNLKHRQWYDARVEDGVEFGESNRKNTPFIGVTFFIEEPGECAGEILRSEFYVTDGTKDRIMEYLAVLGFNPETDDLNNLNQVIREKQCAIQIDIQNDDKFGKQIRVNGVKARGHKNKPGGVVAKIAQIFGNSATPIPAEEPFEGQF